MIYINIIFKQLFSVRPQPAVSCAWWAAVGTKGEVLMTWNVTFQQKYKVILISYSGIVSIQDMQESTSRAILVGRENGSTMSLVDVTGVERLPSVVEIIDLPKSFYISAGVNRNTRVAVLFDPGIAGVADAIAFYETASVNRGWNVRSFASRPDALAWLAEG